MRRTSLLRKIALVATLAGVVVANGCSSSTTPSDGIAPSDGTAPGDADHAAGRADGELRGEAGAPRWAAIARRFGVLLAPGSSRGFDEGEDGSLVPVLEAARVSASLPSTAGGTVALRARLSPSAASVGVEVRLDDTDAEVGVEQGGGLLFYPEAGPELTGGGRADVLVRATERGVEDFVHFSSAPERERVRYHVVSVGGATLTLSDGGVDVLDSDGVRRMRMKPPVLEDATGRLSRADVALDCDGPRHACELTVDWGSSSVVYPALLDPSWELSSQPMFAARTKHTATPLGSGDVVMIGGFDPLSGTAQGLVETYRAANDDFVVDDPVSQQLATPRGEHTATRLPGPPERVLVTGGYDAEGGAILASAELYDVATNAFVPLADSLSVPRAGHTATLLDDGTVLIAGGSGIQPESAELFDPATGLFASVGNPMLQPRRYHTAEKLSGGTVLLAGGFGPVFTTATAEVYDPVAGTFTITANAMTSPRAHATSTLLLDGTVLLGGGTNGVEHYSTADIFDPGTGQFTQTTPMAAARSRHTASRLPTGLVVLTGGQNTTGALFETEIFDPTTGAFGFDATLNHRRVDHTAATLPSGQVVVAGGSVGAPASSAELLKRSNGDACAVATECASGNCAPDGVCCDSECTDACDACTLAVTGVADGVCSPVPAGSPAAGDNSAQCTGSIAFVLACDGLGNVTVGDLIDCKPFGCNADDTGCASTCDPTSGCDVTAFCDLAPDPPVCVPKLANGAECLAGSACASGFCADGRCCNVACDAACESCVMPGAEGECRLVTGEPPVGKACEEPVDAQCFGTCNGLQAECVFPERACGTPTCENGLETARVCIDKTCTPRETSCGAYRCDESGESCRDSCDQDNQCSGDNLCTTAGECAKFNEPACDGNTVKSENGVEGCSPYVCEVNACRDSCRSVLDCVDPFVCNEEGRCIAAPSSPEVPDGCATSPRPRAPWNAATCVAFLAALALVRRRSALRNLPRRRETRWGRR